MEKEIREIIKSDKELKDKINAILNLPFTFAGNEIKEVEQALLELVPAAEETENKYNFIRESLNSIATQNEFINSPKAKADSNFKENCEMNKNSSIESLSNRLMDISNKQKEKDENNTDFESEEKETLTPMLNPEQRRYIKLSHPKNTGKYTTIKGEEKNGDKMIPSQEATEEDITASQLGSFNAELTPILNSKDNNSVGSNITQSNTPDYLMNRLAANTLLDQQQKYITEEREKLAARDKELIKLDGVYIDYRQEVASILKEVHDRLAETTRFYKAKERQSLDKIDPSMISAIPEVSEIFNEEIIFKK